MSQEDRQRVEMAIKSAESRTNAEIFAVLAERSDDYRFVAYCFIGLWVFVFSIILALFMEWQDIRMFEDSWTGQSYPLLLFVLAQASAFATGIVVFRLLPALAVMIVPVRIAHERAHDNAVRQFLARGIHHTEHRTGLLIFISLEEQYAEILVDRKIEEKIGREYFLDQVKLLVESCNKDQISRAFEESILTIGEKLAEACPKDDNDRNELSDKLIVI